MSEYKKTKAMIISKGEVVYTQNLIMEGNVIEFVPEFRYLGVLVDNHLNLRSHCEKLVIKLKQKMSVLRKIRYALSTKTKIVV